METRVSRSVGSLVVNFHRTVRVADGRVASNLPPSLGIHIPRNVSDYREHCPETWEDGGLFVALYDTEALWISFRPTQAVAVMCGAGGINAVNGKPLGTTLEPGNYFTCPPQPWLDGFKGNDGTVYQFVATPFEKGDGLSVGEQILREKSVSGGIGLAVFEAKIPGSFKWAEYSPTGSGMDPYGNVVFGDCAHPVKACASGPSLSVARSAPLQEMGLGKGGRITQEILADPYGIGAWNKEPSATQAIYLISAEDFKEITGEDYPKPVGHETYNGLWFLQNDSGKEVLEGTDAFVGLKSVFAGAGEGDG